MNTTNVIREVLNYWEAVQPRVEDKSATKRSFQLRAPTCAAPRGPVHLGSGELASHSWAELGSLQQHSFLTLAKHLDGILFGWSVFLRGSLSGSRAVSCLPTLTLHMWAALSERITEGCNLFIEVWSLLSMIDWTGGPKNRATMQVYSTFPDRRF